MKFRCGLLGIVDDFLKHFIGCFISLWKCYEYLCAVILIFVLMIISYSLYLIADVGTTLVFLALVVSVMTVVIQGKKLKLAKVEAEVSALLEARLEIIRKLRIIYDYDDHEMVQNLYDEHSVMVEFLFGRTAVVTFDRIRHLQNVTGRLANLRKPPTPEQDELFNNSYDELCEQKDNFYDILYKSIRVSSYI